MPGTYDEAMNSGESREWERAIEHRDEMFEEKSTWSVVDKPEGERIINVKVGV